MIPQTPWLQRSFNFDFNVGLFPVVFSRLEGSIFRLQHIFHEASEERAGDTAHGWSAKEHAGHLFDLEELWWKRWEDFYNRREKLTAADMSNAKTHQARHNEKSISELLDAFNIERKKILKTVYSCGQELLERTSLHPRLNKPMRLIDYLYFIAEHDDHHIAAISQLVRD